MDILQEALDATAALVALLDRDGRVVVASSAWREWVSAAGGSPEDDDIHTLLMRLPEHAEVGPGLAAVIEGSMAELQVALGRMGEDDLRFELRASARPGGGARVLVADVTRRDMAEEELQLERRIAEVMALSLRLEDAARPLLNAIGGWLGAEAGALWEPVPGGRLVCRTRWVTPRLLALGDALDADPLEPRRLPAKAFASGQIAFGTVSENLASDEVAAAGLEEVLAFPLTRGRRRYGVIELFAERFRGRRDRMHATLSSLGERIALSVERYRVERTLRDIVENAPDALFMIGSDGHILMASKLAAELTQIPSDALVGLPIEDLLPASARVGHVRQRQLFLAEGRARSMGMSKVLAIVRADGREIAVDVSLAPIDGLEGRAVLAAVRDVSQRRALEEEAAQRRRLDALVQMATGIARELEEPVDRLQVAVDMLGVAPSSELLAEASHNVHAIAEVVQALEQLTPTTDGVRALTDLNAVVRTTLTVSRNEWKPVAHVATELDGALPRVVADESELTHALFELIVNASHAIAAKGTVDGRGAITVRTRQHEGFAELEIEDTGIGLSAHVRDHLFEPFFTTKPGRRGRGQGLPLVRSVVQSHGGELVVDSREGQGTTFRLRLPVAVTVAPGELPRA